MTLIFALELHRAECEFLTGALTEADARLAALSQRAANTVERATVACLRIDLYTDARSEPVAPSPSVSTTSGSISASTGRRIRPTRKCAANTRGSGRSSGAARSRISWNLPLMSDPASLATLDLLTKLVSAVWHTDANLACMAICGAVNLSLERGNSDGSCYHYVSLGHIAGPRFGDYRGRISIRLARLPTGRTAPAEALPGQDLQRLRGSRHTVDETCPDRPRYLAACA